MTDFSAALEWLDQRVSGRIADGDLIEQAPDLTHDDAYRLQFALMDRKAAQGDAIVGYKAAYTSAAMQQRFNIPGPVLGTLLRSGNFDETTPIRLAAGDRTMLEPEIAVLLRHDLAGPHCTLLDVVRATECLLPSIEVAAPPPGGRGRSRQMSIAVHKLSGGIIVGQPSVSPHGIDLRLEGAVISINGRALGSGTGVEVLGHPLNAVCFIANKLAAFGRTLKAGMLVMTGSIVAAVPAEPGGDVRVDFTRLGSVAGRFAG